MSALETELTDDELKRLNRAGVFSPMAFKVIRNEQQHLEYLTHVKRLIERDPKAGSNEGEILDLLVLLVSTYENKRYPLEKPAPKRSSELDSLDEDIMEYIVETQKNQSRSIFFLGVSALAISIAIVGHLIGHI